MRMGICALSVAALLGVWGVLAQDPKPKTATGPKATEFQKLHRELRETIDRLRKIQDDYKEVRPERLEALEKEFNEKQAHAKKLLAQAQAAAEAAIKADATSPEVIDFLGAMALKAQRQAREEEALRLAQLVLEKKPAAGQAPRRPKLYEIAGTAAFNLSELDAAEQYFTALKDYPLADLGTSKRYLDRLEKEREYWQRESELRAAEAKADDLPRVRIETSLGDVIEVELLEKEAPNTVANFIHLVESGYYDGKPFYFVSADEARVGRPDDKKKEPDSDAKKADGKEKKEESYTIPCECIRTTDFRRHFRGSLSMVLDGGEKDTGYGEFRITMWPWRTWDSDVDDKGNPQGGSTVFGRVIRVKGQGMEALSKLSRVDANDESAAAEAKPAHITKATVWRKRKHEYKVKKVGDAETKPAEKKSEKPKDKQDKKEALKKPKDAKTGPKANGKDSASKNPKG